MIKIKKNNADEGYVLPNAKINISGGNKIIRRNISKSAHGGTVKERWSTDDFSVNITGVIISRTAGNYPKNEVRKLLEYLRYAGNLLLVNEGAMAMGITAIAVESYNLPQTDGVQNQAFSIAAYSDERFKNLKIGNYG